MTKYILHGGAAKRESEDNNKFFKEIVSNLSDNAKVLVVCAAKDPNVWNEVFEATKKTFSSVSPEKKLRCSLADVDPVIFTKQIQEADALYMLGGTTLKLKEYLAKVPNLEQLWDNKTVAGSSAGALCLTRYWYENDADTYNQGLGILPFKLFCHYTEEQIDKLERLKAFGDSGDTRTLPEEKFIIIEQ